MRGSGSPMGRTMSSWLVVPVHAEGQEEEPRLVDVRVGAVDDRDHPLLQVQPLDEQVGDEGAAGAGAEDDDVLHGGVVSRRCGCDVVWFTRGSPTPRAISAATASHVASNASGVKPAPEGNQSPVRPLASV